jgi:hypothetical protein
MKKFIFIILLFIFISCNPHSDPNLVYHGHDWVVKKLNDTVVICIPTQGDLLGRQSNKPYVINIKDFSQSEFRK